MGIGNDSSKQLFKGAAILTAAAIIVKVLSAIYRIPFQNMVGDTGFYIYQQVYPFYGIAVVIATYGFPVGVSKLLVEEEAKKDGNVIRAVWASFIWIMGFGCLLFLLLFLGAPYIASLMRDQQLTPLIRLVAFVFLIIPILSVARGYYQAKGNMVPTAVSQTIEQVVRVTVILFGSYILVQRGFSLYSVGKGAILGSIMGSFIAALILLYYFKKREEMKRHIPKLSYSSFLSIGKILMLQGLAFCLSNMYMLLLQLTDAFQIYPALVEQGIAFDEAKAVKGIYDRGQPLIQVGMVAATSISLSIVPVLASLSRNGNVEEIKNKSRLALKISTAIGLGATIGLVSILKSTNIMLFKDDKGIEVLSILAISIMFASILITGTTILQSLGHWRVSVIILLLSLCIKAAINSRLVLSAGVNGGAWANLIALLCANIAILYILRKRVTGFNFMPNQLLVMLASAISMFVVVSGFTLLFSTFFGEYHESRMLSTIHALASGVIGGFVYIYLLIKMKLFTSEELGLMPGGNVFAKWIPRGKF